MAYVISPVVAPACSSRNLLGAGVAAGPWRVTKFDRRNGRPGPCDTTDPVARLAAILRKPRHLGGFDLAVRTAQWSLWGRKPDQDRGGTGRGRTGGGAGWGVRTGRVLPGESAGPAPTAVRRRRGPWWGGVLTAPICAVSSRDVRARVDTGGRARRPLLGRRVGAARRTARPSWSTSTGPDSHPRGPCSPLNTVRVPTGPRAGHSVQDWPAVVAPRRPAPRWRRAGASGIRWGSRGLNPGPTDYESAALTG